MNDLTDFAVLGSGSVANSYIFKVGEDSFAVDNGFSCREFLSRAREFEYDPESIRCIFLTHTHDDHVRGIERLSKTLRVPVYMGRDISLRGSVKKNVYKRIDLDSDSTVDMSFFEVTPFAASHDSQGALGFRFDTANYTFTIVTDTGIITPQIHRHAFESDILFIESNYDEDMLSAGSYPKFLKDRIASDHGHLSNSQAVEFINDLALSPTLKSIYMCHLSKNNNSVEVLKGYLAAHAQVDLPITICPRGAAVRGKLPQ